MTVKGGEEVLKELLNKMKSIKNICAAFAAGRIYSPYVRTAMEQAKEWEEQRQAGENIKYAKGGVVEPFKQQFELDKDEKILTLEEWKKSNPVLLFDGTAMAEAVREMAKAAQAATISVDKMAKSINEFAQKQISAEERQNTNNWRKMHGLPMRRKAGRRKSVNKKA